jgi:hypothetical protein
MGERNGEELNAEKLCTVLKFQQHIRKGKMRYTHLWEVVKDICKDETSENNVEETSLL